MFRVLEAAHAIGGIYDGDDVIIKRVTCDSRNVVPGDLFIALNGKRFDAHKFVSDAFDAGATAALVSDNSVHKITGNLLRVKGCTRLAFGRLAAWWRDQFKIPVIGITGSNGKTTVKEMVFCILQEYVGKSKVLATIGNLNNEIGVPMTIMRLRKPHCYMVVELGMNHKNEISYLAKILKPTIGLINNAGKAHIGNLGTISDVAEAKGEIIDGLQADARIILNGDDPFFSYWQNISKGFRLIVFGLSSKADVSACFELTATGSFVEISFGREKAKVNLSVPGQHNIKNALASTAVCLSLGVPLSVIAEGLSKYQGVVGRLRRSVLPGKIEIFDDTYNANPDSVKAAIEVLISTKGQKFFVMGDMGELGEQSCSLHEEIGSFAKERGISFMLGLGHLTRYAVRSFGSGGVHHESKAALAHDLVKRVRPGSKILVKGSRSMGLEEVVTQIINLSASNYSEPN